MDENIFACASRDHTHLYSKDAQNTPNAGKVEWFLQGVSFSVLYICLTLCLVKEGLDSALLSGYQRFHFLTVMAIRYALP